MSINSKMTAIADAIRVKTGKTDALTLDAMASEIEDIIIGVELNFEVIGSTTQPSNPVENTIWVNTDQEITEWGFSKDNPFGSTGVREGSVWFTTGETASTNFNGLKENHITIYPLRAHQRINGAWILKDVQIYQNNAWTPFIRPIIVTPNNIDYPASAWTQSGEGTSMSVTSTNTIASYSDYDNNGYNMRIITVDVTNYSTMELVGTTTAKATGSGGSSVNLRTGLFNGTSLVIGYATALKGGNVAMINNTYDISNLTGKYQFGFCFQVSSTSGYSGSFNMTSIIFT